MRPWPGAAGRVWRRAGGRGPPAGRDPGVSCRARADYDAYCIRSSYYLCRVGEDWSAPRPQPYEIRLGFTPGWFPLAEALQTNKTQLAGPCPQWTARETRVLAELHRWQASGLLT
jgi:hypothetical protein